MMMNDRNETPKRRGDLEMNTHLNRILGPLALAIALAGLSGCGGSSSGSDGPTPPEINGQIDQSGDFVPVTDPAEQQKLIDEIWASLIRPQCWDSSYIGEPTYGGTPGNVSQLSFFGQAQYRYVGFEIWTGSVRLLDVGHYKGFQTAIISTWTDDVEAVIIISDSHIVHVTKPLDGTLIPVEFGASEGPCL